MAATHTAQCHDLADKEPQRLEKLKSLWYYYAGIYILTAEFTATGRSTDPAMPGATGTLTLHLDEEKIGAGDIITQPGYFCAVGDGICVGRDSASSVTPDCRGPFEFTGGTIDKVVVDVSGEPFVDHEARVRGWFAID